MSSDLPFHSLTELAGRLARRDSTSRALVEACLTRIGTLDGKPWTLALPAGPQPISLRQYARVEGHLDHPAGAVVKTVQVRVLDNQGGVRASQTVKL